jgi:uncharacterized protein (DUF342 family)
MTTQAEAAKWVQVALSADQMRLLARCSRPVCPLDELTAAALEQIQRLGTKLPIDPRKVRLLLEGAMASAKGPWEVCLIQGRPPKPPVDERIEWQRDFFGGGFSVDPDSGRINYRQRTASQEVAEGELLATIVPGVPGEPGVNAMGDILKPRPFRKASLRCEKNVRCDPAQRACFAAADGRLRLSANALAVDETFTVRGDVNLETGNVHFGGRIAVAGNVEDMTELIAHGSIDVGGVIGAARVDSGADVNVGHGIAGRGKADVRAAGSVCCAHACNARIQAGRDVLVHREIVQSQIACRGSLLVRDGRVVGGEAVALAGIIVAEAGSEAEQPTLLVAGEDHTLEAARASHQEQMAALDAHAAEANEKIAAIKAAPGALTAAQREQLTELMFAAETAEDEREQVRQELEHHEEDSAAAAASEISIRKRVHPKTTVRIRGESLTIEAALEGPLVIRWRGAGRALEVVSQ